MSENKIDVTSEMASRIKEERKRLKLSQDEMAEKLDMSGKNYGRIERADQGTYLRNFRRMAEIFGVDTEYLLCNPQYPYRDEQDRKEKYKAKLEAREAEWRATWNEAIEKSKKAKENNEPWIEYAMHHKSTGGRETLVNCNKISVSDLIVNIAKNGGYGEIMDGLKRLSNNIRFD